MNNCFRVQFAKYTQPYPLPSFSSSPRSFGPLPVGPYCTRPPLFPLPLLPFSWRGPTSPSVGIKTSPPHLLSSRLAPPPPAPFRSRPSGGGSMGGTGRLAGPGGTAASTRFEASYEAWDDRLWGFRGGRATSNQLAVVRQGSRGRGVASNRPVAAWPRLHVWQRNLESTRGGVSEAPEAVVWHRIDPRRVTAATGCGGATCWNPWRSRCSSPRVNGGYSNSGVQLLCFGPGGWVLART
jgi:hypothetical protein